MHGPSTHRTLQELESWWDHVECAPSEVGTVEMLVRRPEVDRREELAQGVLTSENGLDGDNWRQRGSRANPDGSADPLRQLTVMSSRVLEAVAGDRRYWPAAGDQICVDFDLSHENLPAGSRLEIGSAVIEITEPAHTGCSKFKTRFGRDALQWVNGSRGRALRLRGANARVIEPGQIAAGAAVRKV